MAKRWWILATVAIAQLMVVLDATIVNIALPAAQQDLGFDDASRQWIVTAYSLAFGSLLLLGGRLNDRFGQRRSFLIGLIGFAAASALGGWAPDFTVLVAARAIQGAFGAVLAPAALSIMTVTFQGSKDRGKAFGVYGAVAGGGGAIGLLLGGLLTSYLSWRWCLYVNIFFALVAIVGALVLLSKESTKAATKMDWPGTILVVGGLLGVVFGFGRSETAGWTSPDTLLPLLAGAVMLIAFVYVQTKSPNPLLPLSVVLHRVRGTSYAVMLLAAVAMFSIYLFLTYYLQRTLGYSPILAGVAFLPMALSVAVSSSISSTVLLPLLGLKIQVGLAALLGAAGLLFLTTITAESSYLTGVLPGLLAAGLGLGTIFSTAMGSATVRIDQRHAGIASAAVNTTQQVGGSAGVALLSSVSASAVGVASYHLAFWCAAIALIATAVLAFALYPGRTSRSLSTAEVVPVSN
jgi:EmrB/QacA subfamily drug resistance transporter